MRMWVDWCNRAARMPIMLVFILGGLVRKMVLLLYLLQNRYTVRLVLAKGVRRFVGRV